MQAARALVASPHHELNAILQVNPGAKGWDHVDIVQVLVGVSLRVGAVLARHVGLLHSQSRRALASKVDMQ